MERFKKYIQQCFFTENYDRDTQITYLYNQNFSLDNIRKEMQDLGDDVSSADIYRSLKKHGVLPNRRMRPYRDDVFHYKNNGLGIEEIAQVTGYSSRQVRNILSTEL